MSSEKIDSWAEIKASTDGCSRFWPYLLDTSALQYRDLINNVTFPNALIKARPVSDCVMDYSRFTSLCSFILHISGNQITEAALGEKFGASPNKVAGCHGERRKGQEMKAPARQRQRDIEA